MNTVINIILNYVEPEEEITLDSDLRADCGLSSFDMICVLQELTAEFSKDVSEKSLKDCVTVGDLCRLFDISPEETV